MRGKVSGKVVFKEDAPLSFIRSSAVSGTAGNSNPNQRSGLVSPSGKESIVNSQLDASNKQIRLESDQ